METLRLRRAQPSHVERLFQAYISRSGLLPQGKDGELKDLSTWATDHKERGVDPGRPRHELAQMP